MVAFTLPALALSVAVAVQWVPNPADRPHPRLRYADSLVSVNDRCIVSGAKLNPHMSPTYVNGRPVGYC